ncbi:hypothetical protein yc1106_05356 [Curvularia clavata]|uniref:RNA ligase domain-containing protein n=1 Tax=Curvularia clavata TaxID=95742 RepID=A0A9Q9DSU2_CURCL|nr:hypothetical protein yc1106_05356 [Curvularia clavata]
MTTTSDAPSTLYPKITSHISEVVDSLLALNRDPESPESEVSIAPIPIIGTVKLHGTHGDILIYHDNTIVFQSRNTVGLSALKDNQGFAAAMSDKTTTLLRLRDSCVSRWRELHPNSLLCETYPVILAGEWIGTKIQKDVAVSQLSRRFVIVSLSINAEWQKDQDYADNEAPEHDVYNICQAGVFHATLYPHDVERTAADVEQLAEQVAAKCPFARLFGVDSAGEGIVWKLCSESETYHASPALWFKTKGGKFKQSSYQAPRRRIEKNIGDREDKEARRKEAEKAAQSWCGTLRLEQGWDVLREKGIKRDAQGLGAFLTWVQQDILIEEKTIIQHVEMDEVMLKKEIAKIARPWYKARVRDGIE